MNNELNGKEKILKHHLLRLRFMMKISEISMVFTPPPLKHDLRDYNT